MNLATAPSSSTARPFCKWAGGKTQLLPELRRRVPSDFNRYFEPFVGGGAMLLDMLQQGRTADSDSAGVLANSAIANDSNEWLVATYIAVRDEVASVLQCLRVHEHEYREAGAKYYYDVRSRPRATVSAWVAADFIFLNKAGFNGLYRVNRAGQFNVPAGRFKSPPRICDEENLRACSRVLQGVTIAHGDFGRSTASRR